MWLVLQGSESFEMLWAKHGNTSSTDNVRTRTESFVSDVPDVYDSVVEREVSPSIRRAGGIMQLVSAANSPKRRR
jgi:hypothetical protein